MHMLSDTGLVPNSCAICGRAVATMVASRVCMMSAQATMSGMSLDFGRRFPLQAGLAWRPPRADHRDKAVRFEEEQDGPGRYPRENESRQLQDRRRAGRHRPHLLQAARAAAR